MFIEDKARYGDILQHRKIKGDILGDIIDFFTLRKGYAHTAMYVGNGYKVEAHAGEVFKKVKIHSSEYENIDIFRYHKNISGVLKSNIANEVKKLMGKEYDFIGLVGTLRSTLGNLLNWAWLRDSKPAANDLGKYFCSEAIATIYSRSGIDICPEVSDYATTPNDLSRSSVLVKIS
jgi:uncharacterized protein YycO